MIAGKEELHIAMFIPSLEGGGAERVFVQLANGFASKVRRVDLLVARSDGHYRQFVSSAVNIVDFGKSRTLASLFALRKYLKDKRPDVVLSTLIDANLVLLLATRLLKPRPSTVIRETVMLSEDLRGLGEHKAKSIEILARLLYPRADAVVSLSKGVAMDLERMIGNLRRPVRVIYNPGPSEQELCMGGRPSEQFLECKRNGFVLVALGRLHEQKDYPTLIRAFASIREEVRSSLWILGEGEERTKLEMLVREMGLENDVFMPGFVSNPYPYLKAADLFVMSSKFEGGPNSMLQAMACGCKVVSTDAPSGPAEFLENGRQGRLVPVGEVAAFADAALRSLNESIDLTLREKSMRRFDPQFIVDEYLGFLYNVSLRD